MSVWLFQGTCRISECTAEWGMSSTSCLLLSRHQPGTSARVCHDPQRPDGGGWGGGFLTLWGQRPWPPETRSTHRLAQGWGHCRFWVSCHCSVQVSVVNEFCPKHFISFYIASNFNILKTEIIFVQAGLSWSFCNLLNCEMDYRMLK